jgi:hypothetical protein
MIVEKITTAMQHAATVEYMARERAAVLIPAPCFCRGYYERHYHTMDPGTASWCAVRWWAQEKKRRAEAE